MKKIKKILLSVAIGILLLIVIAAIIIGLFLGNIVKAGMEKVGPKITLTSIQVDAVDLSVLTGSASVKGLIVGNPDGYKTPQAIKIGKAEVRVDPFSILSEKIVIRTIHLKAPEITFEGGFGGNNLSQIMDNVNSVAKNGGPAPAATNTTSAAKTPAKPAKKFEVDDFLISGAKVHVSLTGIGGREMTLPLPEIHLTDLGKGSDGITSTELTRAVLSAITTATIKAVSTAASDLGKDAAGIGVEKIKSGIGSLFGK